MFERIRRNSRRVAGAAAIATMAAVGIAWPAHADTPTIYRITTLATLALDVSGGSHHVLAPVIQWPINGGRNQEWTLENRAGGLWIRNVESDQCLTVLDRTAGSGLVQYPCMDERNEEWNLTPVNSGTAAVFTSVDSGMAVDVPRGTGNWGTQLIQWPVNGFPNQNLWLQPIA
ncbi:MAG TPA: RICIN domain-containing protein [Amycolatopsis sp.]|nr:RICIN domain-containing protein [Amycolatopsis sp.]